MSKGSQIVLLHATPVAMAADAEAFDALWPDSGRMHLPSGWLAINLSGRPILDRR